jgi:cytochrome c-type biogenesis protein CcmE
MSFSKRQKRITLVVTLLIGLGSALGLILYALRQNIHLFYAPAELSDMAAPKGVIRVGGMVVKGLPSKGRGLKA